MQRSLIAFAVLFLAAAPALADPPVPPSKKERLNLEEKLRVHKAEQQELEGKVKEIEQELDTTKDRLVSLGKSILNSETTLQALEEKIAELEVAKAGVEANLQSDRQSIARLILALERIRRVPPEALIAQPGAPLKTAQSAMLMRDIMPAIHKQAAMLRTNLQSLENISKDLNEKRDRVLEASASLKTEHANLSTLVTKREKLYASTHQDLEEQEQNVRRISAQAQNLQDLVRKLEKDRADTKKTATAAIHTPDIALPSPGQPRLPISGIIRTGYDDPDAFGAPSKGLSIEGRVGALVVAPMGGVIRFAGPFKNYGNMVILEHKNGYHSLIAGLEKIDTVVGQNVSAGEPIGLLHNVSDGAKPILYYELRLKGEPVNPAQKFAGLG